MSTAAIVIAAWLSLVFVGVLLALLGGRVGKVGRALVFCLVPHIAVALYLRWRSTPSTPTPRHRHDVERVIFED